MNDKALKIKRALISVSDKTNLEKLGIFLHKNSCEIYASGGTKKYLESFRIPCRDVQEITGQLEAFDGRMKTLSFELLSSILFRRDDQTDLDQARQLNIFPIDLVVCNFYPFEKKYRELSEKFSSQKDLVLSGELIESIDIGGPTMLRAAAKNYSYVLNLCHPKFYDLFMNEYKDGLINEQFRLQMMKEAFNYSYQYEQAIYSAFCTSKQELRYGENPHQKAHLEYTKEYRPEYSTDTTSLSKSLPKSLQGKALSYNNYLDLEAAQACLVDLSKRYKNEDDYSAVIIKHSNPCGLSVASNKLLSLELAWSGDPVSSFGSIIALSFVVDLEIVQFFEDKFIEILIAPDFSLEALEVLKSKKNLRLIRFDPKLKSLETQSSLKIVEFDHYKLVQEADNYIAHEYELKTKQDLSDHTINIDLADFGQICVKHLKSNAISIVQAVESSNEQRGFWQIGMGCGNPNRLVSVEQALQKAEQNAENKNKDLIDLKRAYLNSDAFFPFADNIELAAKAGIKHVIEPGGSLKDNEVILACEELGVQLYFTGVRHFKH